MYIPEKDWRAFVNKLSAIDKEAGRLVEEWITANTLQNPKALIAYAYEVASACGTASATLAAIMYDAIGEIEGIILPAAELAQAPTIEDVAKAVNGTLEISQNASNISGAVSRLVKRTGQDTLLQNAVRDHAQFAWIPSGDTCAFCITLASRGWQIASESILSGGHAEHIHSNCDCTYMIRHSDRVNVRGYDPNKYLQMYQNADGSTSKQKTNSMRRRFYAENADKINAQKRAAYALRKEDE